MKTVNIGLGNLNVRKNVHRISRVELSTHRRAVDKPLRAEKKAATRTMEEAFFSPHTIRSSQTYLHNLCARLKYFRDGKMHIVDRDNKSGKNKSKNNKQSLRHSKTQQ